MSLTDRQSLRLEMALAPLHDLYDPAEKMLKRPFSSPGYHTTLKGGMVHPTRESLAYAVALLDTGDPGLGARAMDILGRVIALQDQDPASPWYGIWSWFLEEPLPNMAPADWNWADFLGVQLLQVALSHRESLPADLARRVDDAIGHAARSIRKRNVGPGYTNIAIMGAYVTLVAAETYGDKDLFSYAMGRLRRFHEYSFHHGSFTEYNSPTYTVVALQELGRLQQHVRDPEARRLVDDLYRMAWDEIADHFHAPSRQWAGPHSRCYSTLLGRGALALIERSTGDLTGWGIHNDAPDIAEHRLPTPCPPDLARRFTALGTSHTLVKTFLKGAQPIVGTTYLASHFTLGSINRGDMWNQRRPLIAYWGSPHKPSYLRLRFLHDGYDFSAACFYSQQHGGRVLAGLNFATDGGDTHCSLDRLQDATVRARDLRLRFEFGGAAGSAVAVEPTDAAQPARIAFEEVDVKIAVPYARFGELSGRWQAGKDEGAVFLDVVLYQGEVQSFCLANLECAAIGLAIQVSDSDQPIPPVSTAVASGQLRLQWCGMAVSLPLRPGASADLSANIRLSS